MNGHQADAAGKPLHFLKNERAWPRFTHGANGFGPQVAGVLAIFVLAPRERGRSATNAGVSRKN
jgi:hypothetical protein